MTPQSHARLLQHNNTKILSREDNPGSERTVKPYRASQSDVQPAPLLPFQPFALTFSYIAETTPLTIVN